MKPVSQLESTLISTSPSSVLQQSNPSLLSITCNDASNVALPKDVCDYQNFVLENNVTDIQMKEMIESVFIPEASYKFSKTKKRSLKIQLLQRFPWLCYSEEKDGAFCLHCILFAHKVINN